MQVARAVSHRACSFAGTKVPALSGLTARSSASQERRALHVAAFMTSKAELASAAERFVTTWGSAKDPEAAQQKVRPLLSDKVVFKADGVLYHKDLEGVDAVLEALKREHATNEHVTYQPVAIAANEEGRKAYVALSWHFKNIGPVNGQPETGNVSSGFSLKELTFGQDGRLEVSRVCRQMTAEEKQARLKDASAAKPADVLGVVLPKLAKMAAEAPCAEADKRRANMERTLQQWVGSWDNGGDLSVLDTILADDVALYDCYGLHAKKGDLPQRPSLQGRDAVKEMVGGVHEHVDNKQELQGWAVHEKELVGFEHWQSHAKDKKSGKAFEMAGIDMLLFNPEGRITDVVQFTMQEYDLVKKDA